MDRFDAMTLLLAVVDHGSFSAASRALHVPLATVSRKVGQLEARLGAPLLIRSTRTLELTPAGIDYVAAARTILEQLDEAERQAVGELSEPRGELVVTAPVLFGRLHVMPIVCEFLAAHPLIDIRLHLVDHTLNLIDDHIDVAIRIAALPDSNRVAVPAGEVRWVTCASPALLAQYGTPTTPDDLVSMPCVAIDAGASPIGWRFEHPQGAHEISIRPRLSVTTADAAMAAALNNVGVVRLFHYQAADALANGSLQIVLEAYEAKPTPVNLLYASRGPMPMKKRRFLDFAAPRLRQALQQIQQISPPAD